MDLGAEPRQTGAMDLTGPLLALQQAPTLTALSRLLGEFGASLGFPTHVISPVPTEEMPVHDGWFLVQNWPAAWSEAYDSEGFADFDPIPRAAALLHAPMTLSDIRAGAAGFLPDPRSARMWALADSLDRGSGVLVPVFGPGGYRAIVCFAGPGPDPDPATLAALHMAGLYAHDRVRALRQADRPTGFGLTARETQVLRHASDGLSDAQIAAEIGVSIRTVRFHFSNVRQRLGTETRAQAIALAARHGLLSG